mgnify:CR=1 FL=1
MKDNLPEKGYQLVKAYKEGLFKFVDKFLSMGENYKCHIDAHVSNQEEKLLKPIDKMDLLLNTIILDKTTRLNELSDKIKMAERFKRKSTMPFSYIDFYIAKMKAQKSTSLLMQQGVHYMVALMGGGKSSLIFHTIERLRTMYGRGAYVNVDLEEPHFDRLLNKTVCYHKRFEADDYWGAVEDKETKNMTRLCTALSNYYLFSCLAFLKDIFK